MNVTKGVVIDEPWIGLLLGGTKTWEMRKTNWAFRGWFGLIKSRSKTVFGIARLVEVGSPLTMDEMVATFEKHRIPEQKIRSGEITWNVPWKLEGIRRLARPVPYLHKSGSTIQVNLDEAAIASIARQLGETA